MKRNIIVFGENTNQIVEWVKKKYYCTSFDTWKPYFEYCIVTDKQWRKSLNMPLVVVAKYIFRLPHTFVINSEKIKHEEKFHSGWGSKKDILINLFFAKYK